MRAVLYLFAFLVLVPAYGSPPNIVVYLADDVGIGEINQHAPEFSLIDDKAELARMEQYPQARRIQTPTLERLAREGKRFMRSYAGSSVCSPSRHSLLTGIQVGMAKTRGNGFGPNGSSDVDIEPGRSTFGEIVKSVGYATAAFGKWGAATGSDTSGSPCKHGFDYFFGMFAHTQIVSTMWSVFVFSSRFVHRAMLSRKRFIPVELKQAGLVHINIKTTRTLVWRSVVAREIVHILISRFGQRRSNTLIKRPPQPRSWYTGRHMLDIAHFMNK